MTENSFFQHVLDAHISPHVECTNASFVSGGCINNTLKLTTTGGAYFIKWKNGDADLFDKEILGLQLLKENSPVTIPEVYGIGTHEGRAYLLMEFVERAPQSSGFWENFGRHLALQHKISSSSFGLSHDNHIGRLPQYNAQKTDWPTFFIEQRLQPQLQMGRDGGAITSQDVRRFESLYPKLAEIFPEEPPALLHGDLWGGNFMTGADGEACIFDPAVYFGHREIELAFTQLFGGFDRQFYRSYQEEWPLAPGFDQRADLYNLYPLLVHVNLFGGGYLHSVRNILGRYV